MPFDETDISAGIIAGYHDRLANRLKSDVIIVGAGPSGLVAAMDLAARGRKVTIIEKRLTPGGGVWGGAMGMNVVVVQAEALAILDELAVAHKSIGHDLHRVDAIELAAALVLGAARCGATVLNLVTAEDLCVHAGRVVGVVINRTGLSAPLPIDPLALHASVVVDATGHDAALVAMLRRRGLLERETAGEGPMDAAAGERFVVEHTSEVHAGLWVCGMAVCAVGAGPRMGPIFGGMLLSGRRGAFQIDQTLERTFRSSTRHTQPHGKSHVEF